MVDTIKAWQCIGCGKLEADAQCIGVCQDRPVRLVSLADYEKLEAFVRRVAHSLPLEGQWERSFMALQREAREALGLEEKKVSGTFFPGSSAVTEKGS